MRTVMNKAKSKRLNRFLVSGVVSLLVGMTIVAAPVMTSGTENNDKQIYAMANENVTNNVSFDEDNVEFTFGAISDPHLRNYDKAMSVLNNWRDGQGMDALIIAGDLADRVLYDGNVSEIATLKTTMDETIPEDVDTFFCLGNHDSSGGSYAEAFYTGLGERYYSTDLDKEEAQTTGNRHSVIGGYHFVAVEAAYSGSLPATSLTYLQNTLQSITEDSTYNGEYIFVVCHVAPSGTVLDSVQYSELDATLKEYPQVVLFTGHTHAPIHDERSIVQKDYTVINLGSIFYAYFGNNSYLEGSNGMIGDSYNISAGAMVEMDVNGNIRITRLDFNSGKTIKQAWVLAAPAADKSHLTSYTNDRATKYNVAPTIKENAEVSIARLSDSQIKLTFDRATDDDMVKSYVIELYSEESDLPYATFETLSEFYKYPDLTGMPETKSVTLSGLQRLPAGVRIYATDSFGAMSEPMDTPKISNVCPPNVECFEIDEANDSYYLDSKYEVSLLEDFSALLDNVGNVSPYIGQTVYVREKATAIKLASPAVAIPLEYHTVTFAENSEIYEITSLKGNKAIYAQGEKVAFTVSVDENYSQSNLVVRANGVAINAVNGVYEVENINTDLVITVEGATLNNTSVANDTNANKEKNGCSASVDGSIFALITVLAVAVGLMRKKEV